MKNSNTTFKVEQNAIFNDYRVVKYVDGVWDNARDNNWNKFKAEKIAKKYNELNAKGYDIMD